ncbi:hypothetical protein FB567DRAFT_612887 [Paraphoma chrysanthemicola]|uniref:Uncharacterized protein n=1 Tax=Paraphoma chrysanthemicola TaxID=798071 RepID=A0A8K0VT58_9PLEO|nr:hypothetical protein FB567DRAFT_612887 [Paraphoma chrysanthemicola]
MAQVPGDADRGASLERTQDVSDFCARYPWHVPPQTPPPKSPHVYQHHLALHADELRRRLEVVVAQQHVRTQLYGGDSGEWPPGRTPIERIQQLNADDRSTRECVYRWEPESPTTPPSLRHTPSTTYEATPPTPDDQRPPALDTAAPGSRKRNFDHHAARFFHHPSSPLRTNAPRSSEPPGIQLDQGATPLLGSGDPNDLEDTKQLTSAQRVHEHLEEGHAKELQYQRYPHRFEDGMVDFGD